jgi:predicted component of type VI protein secretion system
MAYVVVTLDGKELCRHELAGTTLIGRSIESQIFLDHPAISRRHCQLEPDEDGWAVADLGSRNGVYVHRDRVARRHLNDGESFKLGPVRVRFHAIGYIGDRPTVPEDDRPTVDVTDETSPGPAQPEYSSTRPLPVPIPRSIPQDALTHAPATVERRPLSAFPTPKPVPFSEEPSPQPPVPPDDGE